MAHILIVDDEELVRATVTQILGKDGHDLTTMTNGLEAIRYCQDHDPDLMITDIVMPDMEGIETIMNLHKDKPNMKIIAMSGGGRVGNFDFLEAAEKLGANRILRKPFLPNDLREAVASCIGALAPV